MDKVMQELGKSLTDQDVNSLAAQHFESQQVTRICHARNHLVKNTYTTQIITALLSGFGEQMDQ